MDIVVKKTTDTASALKVAESSRSYFETGFDDLKKDLKKHVLLGAFLNDEMVGFITYKITSSTDFKSVVFTSKQSLLSASPRKKEDVVNASIHPRNELRGFLEAINKENNPDVVEISWLAVMPKYRKQGIGSKLVKDSLDKLGGKFKIGKVKSLVETHKDKRYAKTRKFYKKLGFISLEIIHPYPGWNTNSSCQIFVKPIK